MTAITAPAPAAYRAVGSRIPLTLLILFAVIVPTSVFYILHTSSQAIGVGLVGFGLLGLTLSQTIVGPTARAFLGFLIVLGVIAALIAAHMVVAELIQPVDFPRALQSVLLLFLMLAGSYFLSYNLFIDDGVALDRYLAVAMAAFVAIGVLALLGVRPIQSPGSVSPVFPFTEPSHYAVTFTPLIMAFCVRARLGWRLAMLAAAFGLAFLLKSLSLVIGSFVISLICLRPTYVAIIVAATYPVFELLDLSYFTERLDLQYQSDNLSALVYLQGWELAQDALARTSGWGVGFQQLGVGPITSPTADKIFRILRNDANLLDGGFVLAKLVAEFGVLGIAFVAAYAWALARHAIRINGIVRGRLRASPGYTVAAAIMVGFSIEMFVRGIGYFSASAMLALAALMFLRRQRLQATVFVAPAAGSGHG